jgi:predicted transposase/invertase (TIGR01784 family)
MTFAILPPTDDWVLSSDQKVQAEYEMRQKAWRDRVSQNEGFYLDGIQKGKMEGRTEGRTEKAEEIAKNALVKGLPLETIHDITGLDIEAIKRLNS